MISSRIVVYDRSCPLCCRAVKFLILLGADNVVAYDALPPTLVDKADKAGIRNELVVIDRESGETRVGMEGLLWAWNSSLGRVLSFPPSLLLLTFLYRTVSYNRRVISPVEIACSCDPDYHPLYTAFFIALCVVIASLVTGMFGAAVVTSWELASPIRGAVWMIGAAGIGWGILFLLSFLLTSSLRTLYLAHLGATMVVGVSALLPATLLAPFLPRHLSAFLFVVSIGVSFSTMWRMQRRRLKILGLVHPWFRLWVVSLASSATIWVSISRWFQWI